MKILLVGEFSGLHNHLKKGLNALGHEVTLVNNGDAFKDFPADVSIKASFFKSKLGNIPRQIWFRLFNYDLALVEHGIRFWWHLSKFKNYDVVQLINEAPIQTTNTLEYLLLKKLFKQNNKIFLLSCGVDSYQVKYMLSKKPKYSVMTPYLEHPSQYKKIYNYYFDFIKPNFKKITQLIYSNCSGIIATDFDYVDALQTNTKYCGYIPYPINIVESRKSDDRNSKITILLGINSGNAIKKGIPFFQKALEIIEKKYTNEVEILVAQNIPYSKYQLYFEKADIVLDQVYSFDQGYNALEAMLLGKVVFTGAETNFLQFYDLKEDEICINALPNVDYLVEKLSLLIENRFFLISIGEKARNFVLKYHEATKIASKYVEKYENNN
jgi:glycosyltransferase involved in cell wall biosynthesis